tara:strand:- start:5587 stop:7257 length:1671 start_codon:yes stop_codon:yes gene_type:complete
MKTLGISYMAFDTSAALMIDGELISCCEEERYNLDKHTREFPISAIKKCLSSSNLSINEIDNICFGFNPDLYHNYPLKNKLNRRPLPLVNDIKTKVETDLRFNGKIEFYEHHLCHAASAYYPSGYKNAVILSNDGIGEVSCSIIARGLENKLIPIYRDNYFPNSLGIAYKAITKFLGWGNGDEGIVMGLAPYGDHKKYIPNSNRTYEEVFDEMITSKGYKYFINDEWFSFPFERNTWVTKKFIETFGEKRKKDDEILSHHQNIAAAIQNKLEKVIISQVKMIKKEFNTPYFCISGGIGLNCSLNGKIEKLNLFDEIFIPPASGDNGISVGACYLSQSKSLKIKPKKIISFSLGSKFTNDSIQKKLDELNVKYSNPTNFYETVANHLSNKKIIGWFQDGAEFGPRALGNRSILASPFPAMMKDHINSRVKFRESFRPFAPAILEQYKDEYFEINQSSPFMLIAAKARKEKKDRIPAVVHVDDSARIQTVNSQTNYKFFKLLEAFNEITNIPVLMNTSFNVKGQPIVDSPEDAIKTFLSTNIDVLVIGDFIALKDLNI